jgi:phage FluMu protein Com
VPLDDHEIHCPHCHKRFTGELIEGRAARYEGFKCPHCKLFVPLKRVEEQGSAPRR